MEINILLLGWLILGLINVGLMFLVQKLRPQALYAHLKYGYMHQVGVLLLWFIFGFLIVPFIVLNSLRKFVGRLLARFLFKLFVWKVKLQKK